MHGAPNFMHLPSQSTRPLRRRTPGDPKRWRGPLEVSRSQPASPVPTAWAGRLGYREDKNEISTTTVAAFYLTKDPLDPDMVPQLFARALVCLPICWSLGYLGRPGGKKIHHRTWLNAMRMSEGRPGSFSLSEYNAVPLFDFEILVIECSGLERYYEALMKFTVGGLYFLPNLVVEPRFSHTAHNMQHNQHSPTAQKMTRRTKYICSPKYQDSLQASPSDSNR